MGDAELAALYAEQTGNSDGDDELGQAYTEQTGG